MTFKPESKTLTLEFPSLEDAEFFKAWLCDAGEQAYWDAAECSEMPFLPIAYHEPGGDIVRFFHRDSNGTLSAKEVAKALTIPVTENAP